MHIAVRAARIGALVVLSACTTELSHPHVDTFVRRSCTPDEASYLAVDDITPLTCAPFGGSDDDQRAPCTLADFPHAGCDGTGCCIEEMVLASADVQTIAATVTGNLLRFEPFESQPTRTTNPAFPWTLGSFRFASLLSHSFAVTTQRARYGASSARFEIRQGDTFDGTKVVRSEGIGTSAETNRHRWYGLSVYLPSASWATTSNWNIITQFWAPNDPGETGKNPPIDLNVQNGRLHVGVKYTSKAIHTENNDPAITKLTYDLGPVPTDRWIDFVWHIKYSYQSDGILELWMNGVRVLRRLGPNSYNDKGIPYFKFGIYNYGRDSRTLFVDEVRVGNEASSYAEVAPRSNAALAVAGFTLVNANTGAALGTINDGATIDRAALPTTSVNIRADTSGTVSSVRLVLSGTQSRTQLENTEPYALFGGDPYASWMPAAGTYTLSATPYTQDNAGGTAGATRTVTFTIK